MKHSNIILALIYFNMFLLPTLCFTIQMDCPIPQDCILHQSIFKKNRLQKINKAQNAIQYPYNACYGYNAFTIKNLTFSNKPSVWLQFTFEVTMVANFEIQMNYVDISTFINLIPLYSFEDPFKKKYNAGDTIVYESVFFDDGAQGFEALRTFNLEFYSTQGKRGCMNFNFVTSF